MEKIKQGRGDWRSSRDSILNGVSREVRTEMVVFESKPEESERVQHNGYWREEYSKEGKQPVQMP